MPHALSLSKTGLTTISLSTGNNLLLDYVPRTPRPNEQFVTESVIIHIKATTGANLQIAVADLYEFFAAIRRYQTTGAGSAGYVNLQLSSDTYSWRSEIFDGAITLGDDSLRHWASNSIELQITWTRAAFWERAWVSLEVANPTTAKTSSVTVYDHHDATSGHTNFADIDGADILGTEPTPLVSLFTSTSTYSTRRFFVSVNTNAYPDNLTAILEGEDGTSSFTGSNTASASASGGYFKPLGWTGAQDHSATIYWSISSTQLAYMQGNWFRVLGVLTSAAPSNCYAKLSVQFPDSSPITTLATGGEVLLQSGMYLQDFGSIQLPPYTYNPVNVWMGAPVALALSLSFRCASTQTINLDFLQLSGPDGVHRFTQIGYQLEIDDWVIGDGRAKMAYIQQLGFTGATQPILKNYDPPAMLYPGQDARVRVLWDEATGLNIDHTFLYSAAHYPRRLSL